MNNIILIQEYLGQGGMAIALYASIILQPLRQKGRIRGFKVLKNRTGEDKGIVLKDDLYDFSQTPEMFENVEGLYCRK